MIELGDDMDFKLNDLFEVVKENASAVVLVSLLSLMLIWIGDFSMYINEFYGTILYLFITLSLVVVALGFYGNVVDLMIKVLKKKKPSYKLDFSNVEWKAVFLHALRLLVVYVYWYLIVFLIIFVPSGVFVFLGFLISEAVGYMMLVLAVVYGLVVWLLFVYMSLSVIIVYVQKPKLHKHLFTLKYLIKTSFSRPYFIGFLIFSVIIFVIYVILGAAYLSYWRFYPQYLVEPWYMLKESLSVMGIGYYYILMFLEFIMYYVSAVMLVYFVKYIYENLPSKAKLK